MANEAALSGAWERRRVQFVHRRLRFSAIFILLLAVSCDGGYSMTLNNRLDERVDVFLEWPDDRTELDPVGPNETKEIRGGIGNPEECFRADADLVVRLSSGREVERFEGPICRSDDFTVPSD